MRAVVISRFGGPEVLELREVETPAPTRGEVRVRVRATAVNRADLLQRQGKYPAPPGSPADIPGMEYAGEVDEVGPDAGDLQVGERVFGLCGGGSYAESLLVPARTVARMPAGLSFVEAAAVPEAFITAWDALVTQAGLGAGERVLIHAVGSGVGTAAVQLARAVGARSVGTARTADKLTRARGLGMDEGVLVSDGKFAAAVGSVDVVLELVGGGYVGEDLRCVAPRGRIVVVGALAGAQAEIDLRLMMQLRVRLFGTVLRARPLEEKILVSQAFIHHVVPLLARGTLGAVVDRSFPLAAAGEAHAYVASNQGFGKVVLEV
jgi:NADPH2:quinone reductase